MLFLLYVIFEALQFYRLATLRLSEQGRVCAGEFIKPDDPHLDELQQYLLIGESKFMFNLAIYEACNFVFIVLLYAYIRCCQYLSPDSVDDTPKEKFHTTNIKPVNDRRPSL